MEGVPVFGGRPPAGGVMRCGACHVVSCYGVVVGCQWCVDILWVAPIVNLMDSRGELDG